MKEGMDVRRIGVERMKYLDLANMSFAAEKYIECQGYIDAFLETVKDDSPSGKEIKDEFDKIEEERKRKIQELEKDMEKLGYLEQRDAQNSGMLVIEIDAIFSRKTICWTTALGNGLFNE